MINRLNKFFAVAVVLCIILSSLSGCSSEKEFQSESKTTDSSPTQSQSTVADNYPKNTEISFGFIDHTMFKNYLTDGTYRCGSDFQEGDYYIMSIYGANALYDVSDSPNEFSWSNQRVFRKVSVKKGQYVQIPSGALLVSYDEFDLENLTKYGIFIVGKDLPEGDYKITSITDIYNTELENISGIRGAYQISNDSPENEPQYCSPLFDKQTYISVKNGQYITINNARMVLEDAEIYDDIATTQETTNESDVPEVIEANAISIVEDTYNAAVSATKSDLTGGKGKWYYKGLPLLSDDCEWIDNPLNKEGTVSQGVVYRKIAKVLSGSDFEKKRFLYKYTDISELLLGFTPETVDEYIPLGKNASEFIVTKNQLKAIMKKFESLKSISGEYNFDYGKFGKYTVDIPDMAVCAKEMQISEEMLGYIFAMLSEYAPEISFDNNSCHIEYVSIF